MLDSCALEEKPFMYNAAVRAIFHIVAFLKNPTTSQNSLLSSTLSVPQKKIQMSIGWEPHDSGLEGEVKEELLDVRGRAEGVAVAAGEREL